MFNLGFTMEELMFPENYQANSLKDKFDALCPVNEEQEHIMIDDEDDDWFTIKQLNPNLPSNDNKTNRLHDQILPLVNLVFDNYSVGENKSMVELDNTLSSLLLPNLSIQITRVKNSSSSSSETVPTDNFSSSSNQQLFKLTHSINRQHLSPEHLMSKSTSSLSFCTQSSTSMTSGSADEMSLNSNDFNEFSTESLQECSYHHKNKSNFNGNLSSKRRRRKRTIFSSIDIEHLKEAFIQNPKPTQQDIALLSEQLGHDSYVIRVWFYNKRQATKKAT